ncbi:MAG TPA: BrnT family toxin [Sphingobium sp.]|uniref:BrnT family toxin n=1 Tax=Sphingobium sp. TaxID=1912891 RepID=UPI002ED0B6E6
MRVTFDSEKRRLTLENRGLDFEDAPKVFAGKYFTRQDDRFDYGEVREISTGLLDNEVVVIVWTERDESRRIISMRKADRDERGEYYDQLG